MKMVRKEAVEIMRMVTREEIQNSTDFVHTMSEEETYELMTLMQKEQPYLQVYVAAICERGDFEDDNDIDVFVNLASIIWHVMRNAAQGPLTEVKGSEIDEREEKLIARYASAEGKSDSDLASDIQVWMDDDPQRHLLEFLLMTLMSPENPYDVTEEGTEMIFTYLKVITDCLNHAQLTENC